MQKWNKALLGGGGGGVGASLAQIVVGLGWVPPDLEVALTVVLATVLGAVLPAFGPQNR